MADVAIGTASRALLQTVGPLVTDRIGLFLRFQKELEKLSNTATRIQGFLAVADDTKHIPEVVNWLKHLERVAIQIENVSDEVNYEDLRWEVKYPSQFRPKVCCCFLSFSTVCFRLRRVSKLRDINMNLEMINREANTYGLVTRFQIDSAQQLSAPAVAIPSRQTDSIVVPNVKGRDIDESTIVDMLLSPSEDAVSVISISGTPGLGKTTLAKLVYRNQRINEHFAEKAEEGVKGVKGWVCVAKETNIVDLFKLILESLTRRKVEVDSKNVIVRNIKEEIGGKRCFLVLDDVWNQDRILWGDFFYTLKGLNPPKSWCLVITTRQEGVTNAMCGHENIKVHPYNLKRLTAEDCWSIIKRIEIAAEETLEALKEQILSRCGGLPLAATLFGGLLHANDKEKWPSIVQKSLLDGHQNGVDQVIKVSYDHLSPASVKKCFAYCSIFPQDTKMGKDLLIELWMAEGFLQPDSKNERLEDIGDVYFRILLQSSLLEEVKSWGITSYKMHDLVHDFAKSALTKDRYLALNSAQVTAYIINEKATLLRTLFLESSISGGDLSKFKCLHVLKLSGKDIKVLPDSIGELRHLRILDISDSSITILPKTICKLYILQTLRTNHGTLEGLPKQMSNLINLRHLQYYNLHAEFQMPPKMGRLIHLQTLEFFNVGQEDGRSIEELGNLKDLKGSLEIRNLELVNGKERAEGAKLFEKPNLSKLTFLWSSGDREGDNHDEHVLEGLQPPPNLQKLKIRNFMGDRFPGWLINLSTLVRLVFRNCEKCRELAALGQLPSLESLKLNGLKNMRSIGFSFYGVSSGSGQVRKCFPCLKYLYLEDMENLEEWKDEDEVKSTTGAVEVNLFPVLVRLVITNCSRLISAPRHFPSIEGISISYYCHVSLLKRSVSNIATLSSLKLSGYMVTDSHNDEHVASMRLEKRRHINNSENNSEGDVEYHLELKGCGSVPGELLEHLSHFPDILRLELVEFPGLTRLMGQESFVLKSLQRLEISKCYGFTSLPGEMLESCASLEELEIAYCDGLTSLPGEMLKSCASLRILRVRDCPNLVYFPHNLQQTPSLEILNLSDCPKLMIADMPKGFAFLTSLRTLFIGPFSINQTNEEFDWSALTTSSSPFTLTSLGLFGLPHVESLPEQLQYFTSLIELRLEGFGIEALPDWIGNLVSLEQLVLGNCRKLRYLPSMAVRRRLTKFTSLTIDECPLLEERYKGDTNSEWPID